MRPLFLSFAALVALQPLASHTQITPAQSERLYAAWKFQESVDILTQKPSCQAVIKQSSPLGNAEAVISLAKDKSEVPQFFIRIQNETTNLPDKVFVQISTKEKHPLFLLKQQGDAALVKTFWYAPVQFQNLLNKIRDGLNLKIVNNENQELISISLSGSTAATDRISGCLKTSSNILPIDFLNTLNQKEENLSSSAPLVAESLRSEIKAAYLQYLEKVKKQNEIMALRNTVKQLLQKEASEKKFYETALKTWESNQNKLNDLKKQSTDLPLLIAQTKTDLASNESKLITAKEILQQKKLVYDNVKKLLLPFETDLEKKQIALNKIISSIEHNENTIARNNLRIPQLQKERANALIEIQNLRKRYDSLEYDRQRAQDAVNRHDVEREYREALSRHSWYSWKVRERESKQSELRTKQWDLSRAQSELRSAQTNLNTCQAQTPPVDCNSHQSAVQQADSKIRNIENEITSINYQIDSLSREIDDIERDTRRKVEDEHKELVRVVDDIRRDQLSLSLSIYSYNNRIGEIDAEIPRLRRQIADAEAALPKLEAQKTQQEALVSESQTILNQEKEKLNFATIESEFNQAKLDVQNLEKSIATAKALIKKSEAQLIQVAKDIKALEPVVAKNLVAKDKAYELLAKTQAQLAPFRQQESVLLAQMEQINAELSRFIRSYQFLYEYLVKN